MGTAMLSLPEMLRRFLQSGLQRGLNCFKQNCVVEGLRQELHSAITHGLNPHFGIAMRGDEDDRYSATLGLELRLQFKARHSRHSNIHNQTSDPLFLSHSPELSSRSQPRRPQSSPFPPPF